jgi:hypothetical protein
MPRNGNLLIQAVNSIAFTKEYYIRHNMRGCRSEDAIRAYFSSKGTVVPQAHRLPSPDPEIFKRWFPGLLMSRTECSSPTLRIVCFPNAGNAEDMYTSEGTGPRRAPSPLLVRFVAKHHLFGYHKTDHN